MAVVALLAIASIPWLATAKATGKLVGYTDSTDVPAAEQVSSEHLCHVSCCRHGTRAAHILWHDPQQALNLCGLSLHVRCILDNSQRITF